MFKKLTPSIIFACTVIFNASACSNTNNASSSEQNPTAPNSTHSEESNSKSDDSKITKADLYPILSVTFPPQYTILSDQWKKTMDEKDFISSTNSELKELKLNRKYHTLTQKQYDMFVHRLKSCKAISVDHNCAFKVIEEVNTLAKNVKLPKDILQAYLKEYTKVSDCDEKITNQSTRVNINYYMSSYLKNHKVTPKQAIKIKKLENNCGQDMMNLFTLMGRLAYELPELLKEIN